MSAQLTVSADERVARGALDAASRQLRMASQFAELHARRPLFQKTMRGPAGTSVIVRLDWPGVLRVFDPKTGQMLAESAEGRPDQLDHRFVPRQR